MKFLLVFFILSIVNVTFSTTKTLITIKGNKLIASLVSGAYYAYYNIMIIYTVSDFPLYQKCIITFICNVIGVFTVKLIEEKTQKDKLWKVEMTIETTELEKVLTILKDFGVPHNYINGIGKHSILNIFCSTKKETKIVKEIMKKFNAKYFASESKLI